MQFYEMREKEKKGKERKRKRKKKEKEKHNTGMPAEMATLCYTVLLL